MNKPTLLEIYESHAEKVSDKWLLYLNLYNRLLGSYRTKEVSMLEIGIQNGGSLEIWAQYFQEATIIIGCDINPHCAGLKFADSRIKTVIGDANDAGTMNKITALSKQFDIIIDDGSHLSSDIVKSFIIYFDLLNDEGVFIAEDLHCSYWANYQGGLFYPMSSISFFKLLADIVNHEHWGIQALRKDLINQFTESYNIGITEDQLARIHSVEFINSVCVVRKSSPDKNVLNQRVVAGTIASIIPAVVKMPLVISDEKNNIWSSIEINTNVKINPIEVLSIKNTNLQNELNQSRNLEKHFADLYKGSEARLAICEMRISEILNSSSWRFMAYFRKVGTLEKKIRNLFSRT